MPLQRLRHDVPGRDADGHPVIASEVDHEAGEVAVVDVYPVGHARPRLPRRRMMAIADFTVLAPAARGYWRSVPMGRAVHWHEVCPIARTDLDFVTEDEARHMVPCSFCSHLGGAPIAEEDADALRAHGLPVPERHARSLNDVVEPPVRPG
jgi:hypothetical protein